MEVREKHKRFSWKGVVVSLALTCAMVPFVNCMTFDEDSSGPSLTTCIDGNQNHCVQPRKELLELRINSPLKVYIKPRQFSFNVSGDCNEGGFTAHNITWKLYLRQSLLTSSNQGDKCRNGRFLLLVRLPSQGESLISEGQRVKHSLVVEIAGQDHNGDLVTNDVLARKKIRIYPNCEGGTVTCK